VGNAAVSESLTARWIAAQAARPAASQPSISSAMPGLPQGKPAGMPCAHLDSALRCRLFGLPERPAVCRSLSPSAEMCGETWKYALRFLERLERATQP